MARLEGLEPPTYRFEVRIVGRILKKINNLARQNPAKSGKIRNPDATQNQIEEALLLPFWEVNPCRNCRAMACPPLQSSFSILNAENHCKDYFRVGRDTHGTRGGTSADCPLYGRATFAQQLRNCP